jgi:outer membrane protein assembly factor BamB
LTETQDPNLICQQQVPGWLSHWFTESLNQDHSIVRNPGLSRPVLTKATFIGAACVASAIISLSMISAAAGAAWPAWGGPQGDGTYRGRPLPLHWNPVDNVDWRVPLSGPGKSSPVVWGDRVFLTLATDNASTVLCLARDTGEVLWQRGVSELERPITRHPIWALRRPSDCSATAVTDGTRVIALFGSSLFCLDLDGNELWLRQIRNRDPSDGLAASPLIIGQLCVVSLVAPPQLAAFDKQTGEPVWTVQLSTRTPGGEALQADPVSTPLALSLKGREQVVVQDADRIRAFDPTTGDPLWQYIPDPAGPASLLWADGILISASSSDDGLIIALRPSAGDRPGDPSLHWRRDDLNTAPAPKVVRRGRCYFITPDGMVVCLDIKTGRIVGQRQLRPDKTSRGTWSALLLAGRHIYAPHDSGEVFVLSADPRLTVLATNSVGEPVHASLAASNGAVFLRTELALWCLNWVRSRLPGRAPRR